MITCYSNYTQCARICLVIVFIVNIYSVLPVSGVFGVGGVGCFPSLSLKYKPFSRLFWVKGQVVLVSHSWKKNIGKYCRVEKYPKRSLEIFSLSIFYVWNSCHHKLNKLVFYLVKIYWAKKAYINYQINFFTLI